MEEEGYVLHGMRNRVDGDLCLFEPFPTEKYRYGGRAYMLNRTPS